MNASSAVRSPQTRSQRNQRKSVSMNREPPSWCRCFGTVRRFSSLESRQCSQMFRPRSLPRYDQGSQQRAFDWPACRTILFVHDTASPGIGSRRTACQSGIEWNPWLAPKQRQTSVSRLTRAAPYPSRSFPTSTRSSCRRMDGCSARPR